MSARFAFGQVRSMNFIHSVMTTYRIAVLVGSIRSESLNRKLADALIRFAPPDFTFHHLKIDDLPLYNQDEEEHPPEAVQRLRREIREADGLLIATPEYNRSIPGVLKNAIDHGSRPGDTTPGRASRQALSACQRALAVRLWPSSIRGIFSPCSTSRRWRSQRRSSSIAMTSSMPTAASAPAAAIFCRGGWIGLLRG